MIEGVLGGFIAAGCFLMFLHQLRPKIQLAPVVAKRVTDNGAIYSIKIVNNGARNIVKIEAELESVRVRNIPIWFYSDSADN
ncbi:MAG: hypothetical protein AB1Y25_03770 [Cycloclasticus sp.]